jgi:hypothetical protein
MRHAWEGGEKCTRFWWESPKEGDHLEDEDRWEGGIRMDPREIGWGVWRRIVFNFLLTNFTR